MERMTPNETGILLLILFGSACICGFITELLEQKKECQIQKIASTKNTVSPLPSSIIPKGNLILPKHTDHEVAFKLANRIVTIHSVEEGYEYYIMNSHYNDLDSGVYDDPNVSILDCINEIVDYLVSLPDGNNIKGKIKPDDICVYINYDAVNKTAESMNKR